MDIKKKKLGKLTIEFVAVYGRTRESPQDGTLFTEMMKVRKELIDRLNRLEEALLGEKEG